MAQLIDPNELFYQNFEPRLKNRFILYVDGLPSYLINKVDRPKQSFAEVELHHINLKRYTMGKPTWETVTMELYDPIVPSGTQIVMEWIRSGFEALTGRMGYADMYKKDITVNELGPVGEKVGEFVLKGAWVQNFDAGDLDWSTESDAQIISLTIRYDYCVWNY